MTRIRPFGLPTPDSGRGVPQELNPTRQAACTGSSIGCRNSERREKLPLPPNSRGRVVPADGLLWTLLLAETISTTLLGRG